MTVPETDSDAPDPYEEGDDLLVESLDGHAQPPLHARVIPVLRRVRHLRRPTWLTHRRMVVTTLMVVLAAAYLLVATGLADQWWQRERLALLWRFKPTLTQTAIAPTAPGTLPPLGDWQRIPLPSTTDQVDSLDFSPTDPQAALACTGPRRDPTTGVTKDGPIGLWHTSDGGQRWVSLPIPARSGTFCQARMARGAPERLILTSFGSSDCQTSHPLLSPDAGQHWSSLFPPLPPLPAHTAGCSLVATITPRHVSATVKYAVLVSVYVTQANASTNPPQYQTSVWTTHSDNDGQTWTAPATMPPDTVLAGSAFGDVGSPLTATGGYVSPGTPPTYGTRFWTSSDLGDSWQRQATLPDFGVQRLLAPAGVTLVNATASKPLYVLSGTEIPWGLFAVQAAQISGRTWARVPPLPVGGTTAERTGVSVVLTATPSGKLLVLGLGPRTTLPTSGSVNDLRNLTQWLWEWDPHAARWNAITPLPPNIWPARCATPCWQGSVSVGADPHSSGAFLWLTDGGDFDDPPMLLRLRLPDGA